MYSLGKDIESLFIAEHGLDNSDATAGGSGDATQVNGTTIDLQSLATSAQSVVFLIAVESTLAEDETLTLAADVQYSSDGSTWSELVASSTILTLTGDTGGSTEKGVGKIGADLTKGDRYVRVRVTPDLSASGTDTSTIMGTALFGGLQELPQ